MLSLDIDLAAGKIGCSIYMGKLKSLLQYLVKNRERKKIDFYQWLFELPANLCQQVCPPGLLGRHWLAGSSEGHRTR